MSDAFLVLGQVPEGLSCFLVPRILGDGSGNGFRFQRLKDKLGNRSNGSSEVEFVNAIGEMVGEPGAGVKTIMYTRPSHRGQKIGARIVERVEALARQEGLKRLVLETGDRHPAAWTVYERAGFSRCGPVLDYPDSKWSVF